MGNNFFKLNIFKSSILLSITIIIFYFLFKKIDFEAVLHILSNSNPFYILVVLIISIPLYFFAALRWHEMLKSINCQIPFKKTLTLVMIAIPIVFLTPSKSGNLVKAYYLRKEIPYSKSIGSILAENFFDIFFVTLLSFIGLIFFFNIKILVVISSIFLLSILLFALPHFGINIGKRFTEKLDNLLLTLKNLTKNPKHFFLVFFYSTMIWIFSLIQFYFFFKILDINVPFLLILAKIPLAVLIAIVPITLGGMGTRDTAIIVLFSGYASNAALLGVGIIITLFRYVIPSLFCLLFIKSILNLNKELK